MSTKENRPAKPLFFALLVAVTFLSLAIFGLVRLKQRQSDASPMKKPVLAIKTVTSYPGALQMVIPALASIRSAATIQIKAETGGRIINLPLREGDKVKKGDLLVTIDGREQQAQLGAAKAKSRVIDGQIASLKAGINAMQSQKKGLNSNFGFLESELKRYEKLFASNAISASSVEAHRNKRNDAESKLLSLQAQIQAQKAQISSLESQKQAARKEVALWTVRSDYSEIRSEVDGVVAMRNQEEGTRVLPGSIILAIEDTSSTRLIMQFPQNAVGLVQLGQKVIAENFPKADFVINRIYPSLNAMHQFVVEAKEDASRSQIKLDLQIPVSIVVKQLEGTVVQRSALFTNFNNPGEFYVYPVANGVASRTSIKPMLIDADGNAVFSPVQIGADTVLAAGSYLENVRLPSTFAVEELQ